MKLVFTLLLPVVLAEDLPQCELRMREAWNKYHTSCDRSAYTEFKNSLGRHLRYNHFKQTGEHALIPEQKTVVCPLSVGSLQRPSQVTGYDTSFIVENKASTPVVLAFVDENGIERSAVNPKIAPPQADPDAIMAPGTWRPIHTFEGHVFHMRQVKPDGSTGNVLLQHRAGLIGVGAGANLDCEGVEDPEPIVEIKPESGEKILQPEFQRTPTPPLKDCNLLEIGFRNLAGCPLHGYYIMPDCSPVFKFHLGTETKAPGVGDFFWDWHSVTKFESTFIGHAFEFRNLAGDVVERVTLEPVVVGDCPGLEQQTTTLPVAHPLALVAGAGAALNATATLPVNATATAPTRKHPMILAETHVYATGFHSF